MSKKQGFLTILFCSTILSFPVRALVSVDVNTDYLNQQTGSKVTWEEVNKAGEDTVEIDGKYYKYTYNKPADYDKAAERINDTLATADVTNKLFEEMGGGSQGAGIYNSKDNSTIDVKADFVKNYLTSTSGGFGIAIYNSGSMGGITGDFVGNYAQDGSNLNGVIWSSGEKMGDIVGNFIGNRIITTSGGPAGIKLYGQPYQGNVFLGNITGNFIGNTVKSVRDSNGSVLEIIHYAYDKGYFAYLGNITGNIIGNSVESDARVYGGAIHKGVGGVMGDITGLMAYNHAKAETGRAIGGAMCLDSTLGQTSGYVTSDFLYNYVESISGDAEGGAIEINEGLVKGITGDFVGNYAKSIKGSSYGGALAHWDANITPEIKSNFLSNQVIGGSSAWGGAIYNIWTYDEGESRIEDLRGSFVGNQAESTEGSAYGGAIANTRHSYISMTNTDIVNNYAKGKEAYGGAIYNNGKIAMAADGQDVLISGNYTEDETGKTDNAIYSETLYDTRAELEFSSKNGGKILVYDGIDGEGYDLRVSGDGSGEVLFNNNVQGVSNMEVSSGGVFHLGKNGVIDTVDYVSDGGVLKLDISVDSSTKSIQNGVLNVSGDVVGTTKVIVNSENASTFAGAQTEFVNASNFEGGLAEQFEVARVVGNPYMWRSVMNAGGEESGSHWYLSLTDDKNPNYTPEYAPEVGAYAGLQSSALEQNRSISGSVVKGLAHRQSINCYEESCGVAELMPQKQAWVEVTHENAEIDSPAEMDAKINGTTLGMDLYREGHKRAGVFGAYRHGKYELSGKGDYYASSKSDITSKSYLGGAYYQFDDAQWRMTGTVFAGKQDMDIKTADGIAKANTEAMQYGASAEVAKRYAIGEYLNLEPSLGLYYTLLDLDGLHDNVGKSAKFDMLHYLEAELGLKLEREFCADGKTNRLYVKPSIVRTFAQGGKTQISGLDGDVKSYKDRTLGRLEVGGEFNFEENWSGYGAAGYTLGNDYNAYDLTVGLGYRF